VSPMSARQIAFHVAWCWACGLQLVGDVVHDGRDHGLDHVAVLGARWARVSPHRRMATQTPAEKMFL